MNKNDLLASVVQAIQATEKEVDHWIHKKEAGCTALPFYSSVDIRHTFYKVSVIDTNLYPAGFNNLSKEAKVRTKERLSEAVFKRVPHCRKILFVIEPATRNLWYLENASVLCTLLKECGFEVTIGTFFSKTAENDDRIILHTSSEAVLTVHDIGVMQKMNGIDGQFDLVILNNDLSDGIPLPLKQISIPIHPPSKAGWWNRSKTRHFVILNDLLTELAAILEIDPWLISCLFHPVGSFDVNSPQDQKNLMESAENLYAQIEQKHQFYGIKTKPFLFLKADSGTSGRGVIPIENPKDILVFNKKTKLDLTRGKQTKKITKFILQEGLETIDSCRHAVCEPVVYSVDNHPVGGFFRINPKKSSRENLSTPNSYFKPFFLPLDSKEDQCENCLETDFYKIYSLLARLAGMAANTEIVEWL